MRFGLNTFLYASPFTNESVSMFKKLKKWGFHTVEIPIEDPSHTDPKVLKAAAILKAGKHLGHFHACGTDRGTPGGDSLDWKPIVGALKKIGYKHDIVIESFTTDVKVIARAAAIWRKMEPHRDDIAVKGLKNLNRFFGKQK